MKQNQGFTLVGLMAIAAMLSIITVAGISIAKYNANQAEMAKRTAQGNQLISNITNGNGTATLQGSGEMQFAVQPTPDPNSLSNPNNPESPNNPDSLQNPTHRDSILNPNHPSNPANPNYSTSSCPNPCHTFTDPETNADSCILTSIDCACAQKEGCPTLPSGCAFVADGPGNPKYQPSPEGQGQACPYTRTCDEPLVLSAKYHDCRCSDDTFDCTPWGSN